MTNNIRQMVSSCFECSRVLRSQPANPMSTASPSSHFDFPIQYVGLDLFSFGGKDYLICVDYWSGYPVYQFLRSTTSDSVILVSLPGSICWDGPPPSEATAAPNFRLTTSFSAKHGIRHELLAPYNLKSNGLAEAGVKSAKNILKRCISSGADSDYMLY